jgi:transcription-repair coupling factor (superfamily II helicase)
MSTQKQLPALENNHITNLAHFDEQDTPDNALNSLALEAIYGTINSCNYQLKNMNETSLNWEFQSTAKAQELIQSWYKPSPAVAIQIQRNMDSAKEAMARMAQRVYENMLGSERGEELLAKAVEYNIPYDKSFINWLELIDLVEEYEALLIQADEYNIDWDLSEYDPVGLQQEINYCIRVSRLETNDLHRYYLDTRF